MKSHLLLAILSVGLAACGSSERPSLYAFTPASVMVDYSESDLHEASQTAQQYCQSSRRNAQFVEMDEVDDKQIGFFNCIGDSQQQNMMSVPVMMPMVMPMMPQGMMMPPQMMMQQGMNPASITVPVPQQMSQVVEEEERGLELAYLFESDDEDTVAWDDPIDWSAVRSGR